MLVAVSDLYYNKVPLTTEEPISLIALVTSPKAAKYRIDS